MLRYSWFCGEQVDCTSDGGMKQVMCPTGGWPGCRWAACSVSLSPKGFANWHWRSEGGTCKDSPRAGFCYTGDVIMSIRSTHTYFNSAQQDAMLKGAKQCLVCTYFMF